MSGPSRSGRWVASSVTEEDIMKLRVARYLTPEILHQLPAEGQIIPTPQIRREGSICVPLSSWARVRA